MTDVLERIRPYLANDYWPMVNRKQVFTLQSALKVAVDALGNSPELYYRELDAIADILEGRET